MRSNYSVTIFMLYCNDNINRYKNKKKKKNYIIDFSVKDEFRSLIIIEPFKRPTHNIHERCSRLAAVYYCRCVFV